MIINSSSSKIKSIFGNYLNFIYSKKKTKFIFLTTFFLFLFLPTQNNYLNLNIKSNEPVVRQIETSIVIDSLVPKKQTDKIVPFLSANSVMAIDVPSKTIIYAKNPDLRLMPASTTKIMTALVALDQYKLDEVITVGPLYNIGQVMNLKTGERMSFENLLYGLLVQSGNDAAYVLADNFPGGLEKFIEAMNNKAKVFHLENTTFHNPTGVEEYGHLTTSHDLAILAAQAMSNEDFARIVKIPTITIWDAEHKISHKLENINKLVGKIEGIKGIKTGWTVNSGECLVSYFEKDNRKIITVLLGSQDRFEETVRLLDWITANFYWEQLKSNQMQ